MEFLLLFSCSHTAPTLSKAAEGVRSFCAKLPIRKPHLLHKARIVLEEHLEHCITRTICCCFSKGASALHVRRLPWESSPAGPAQCHRQRQSRPPGSTFPLRAHCAPKGAPCFGGGKGRRGSRRGCAFHHQTYVVHSSVSSSQPLGSQASTVVTFDLSSPRLFCNLTNKMSRKAQFTVAIF